MPLKRATKSIPLSGGISEDAPDFILAPPGMAYIENARFRKVDSAEKTEPSAAGIATGASQFTPSVEPLGVVSAWANESQVAVIGRNEVATKMLADAAFVQREIASDVMGIERVLNTATGIGAQAGDWCYGSDAGYDDGLYVFPKVNFDYYCVAHEVRRLQDNDQCNVDTVFQVYSLDGTLISQEIFLQEGSPRVRSNNVGGVVLMTVGTYGSAEVNYLKSRLYNSSGGMGSVTSIDQDIRLYPQYYTQATQQYNTSVPIKPEEMRIGFIKNANNTAAMSFDMDTESASGNGIVAWKTDVSKEIRCTRVISSGLYGTTYNVTTDTEGTSMFNLLDVRVGRRAAPNDYSYVLTSEVDTTDTSTPTSKIRVHVRARTSGASVAVATITDTVPGLVYNGSIDEMSNGYLAVAVSAVYNYPTSGMVACQSDNVTYFTINSDFATQEYKQDIRNHRLVSRVKVDEFDNPHGVLQQYANWSPEEFNNNHAVPSVTPTAVKPVTSVLVKFTDDPYASETFGDEYNFTPIAVFNAGSSKMGDHSLSEQTNHLPDLKFMDDILNDTEDDRYKPHIYNGLYQYVHQWFYLNRAMDTLEDLTYYLHVDPNATTFDGRRLLSHSDGHFNLFRCSPDIEVQTQDFHSNFFNTAAVPGWYDGGLYGEACVFDQPEIVDAVNTDGAGATYMAYQDLELSTQEAMVFQAIVGFTDDSGMVHRSAPSFPLFVGNLGTAATTTSTRAKVTVTPPLSMYRATGREYFVEVYYAAAGSTPVLGASRSFALDNSSTNKVINLYFKIHQDPLAAPNDTIVTRAARPLYTEGNVLAADPWPDIDLVTASARRMFATSVSARGDVFYSKIFESGVAPEFNASLIISLGTGRRITALGSVDDKVACFFEDGIYIIYGSGPDNTGANGDFFTEKMNTKIGCTDPESIVTVPDGIMFYSSTAQAFYILTRDMQLVEVGGPIEDITDGVNLNVRAALEYPAENEVRFYCSSDIVGEYGAAPDTSPGVPTRPPRPRFTRAAPNAWPCYVYNYDFQKWTVHTNDGKKTTRATLHGGKPATISTTYIYNRLEDDIDNWTASEPMKWETPWIKVNQIQDFGRFTGATVLGRYLSNWTDVDLVTTDIQAGDLQVTIKYDYEGMNGTTETFRFRANQDFVASEGERLQFNIKPARQKCTAIKFIFEEIPTTAILGSEPTYTNGRGFDLVSLDLHYAMKGGSSRLSATRKK